MHSIRCTITQLIIIELIKGECQIDEYIEVLATTHPNRKYVNFWLYEMLWFGALTIH